MSTARNLKLEVLLQAVDKVTRPFRAITGTSGELARSVKAARDQLKDLNRAQVNIDSFRKLSRDAAIAENQLRTAQARVKALAQEIEGAEKPTAAMNRAFQSAVREAQALKQRGTELQQSLQGVRGRLEAAGISTSTLGQAQRDLRGQIVTASQALAQQEARLRAVGERQRQLAAAQVQYQKGMSARNAMLGAGITTMAAGGATLTPIAKAVKDFVSYEDAMLGIARQIPGARNDAGQLTQLYYEIGRAAKRLGEELPIPTNQVIEMTTAAARMEVGTELLQQAEDAEKAGNRIEAARKRALGIQELLEFNKTVAMMATAFDAVPDQIAESMGKVAKNFKIPVTEIRSLADTINYLDDNAISKGGDIIDVLNRISGVVSTVKMSSADAAALASTLLTLGERTETAGTAINAITQKFAAAEKGTKKFHAAVAEIGLTTQEIQKGMAEDATGTIFKVVEAVRGLPKDKRIGVMVELVGMEHSDTLAKLVDKPEELQRQIQLASGKGAVGSMEREFAARQQTISAAWARLQNKLFNASAQGGEILRPTLVSLMETVGNLVDRFNAFAQANPALVGWLVKGAAAAGALLAVTGALTLALAALLGPLVIARYGLQLMRLPLAALAPQLPRAAGGFGLLAGAAAKLSGSATKVQAFGRAAGAALTSVWQASAPAAAWPFLKGYVATLGTQIPAACRRALAASRRWGVEASATFRTGAGAVRAYTTQLWGAVAAQLAAARAAAASRIAGAGQYVARRGIAGVAADAGRGGVSLVKAGAAAMVHGASAALLRLGQVLLFVGRLALANPIGLAITAVAAGALLVIRYWEPIKAFFAGMWAGLSAGLAPLAGTFDQVFAAAGVAMAPLRPAFDWLLGAIQGAWRWITNLLAPVDASRAGLDAAARSGEGFGRWLASIIVVAAQLLSQFASLPLRFVEIGAQIMQGLVNGITSGVGAVKDAITGAGSAVIGYFKEKLGIHSPSRVFAELGGFTMAGLTQGIERGHDGPLQAVSGLAGGLIGAGSAGLKSAGAAVLSTTGRVLRYLSGAGAALAIAAGPAAADPTIDGGPSPVAAALSNPVPIDRRPPLAAGTTMTPAAAPAPAPITINIYPPAGADEREIARLVEEKLRQIEVQRSARQRSSLTDRD
ncbi:phage tail tape measure protein [Cupriavidus taiwanensis]|uniref:Bacteriophage P2 tail protein GPT putative tail length determinator (Modular protein) n=1 Tax=Cupriavidus taiwanensis TaxID=164546 RepID=A0A375J2W5_9BURK|nr:phage tail tape measure protein [Cupriavidus taiwanensis]SPR99538.1 Bacteriophage P2 tail protein GPT putative tail length determinator (modular protein) [Cupriavidus taiwanensis]